ncbi:MAG: DUF1015 domain-containing protein [Chloroflexi bacterium]|nr:DUF1015 domain-containing protein [Chloroflexota bacterium]MDL1943970.1 DUF1015 domain-containing protein [Chloroflexi bacterium CFX2]
MKIISDIGIQIPQIHLPKPGVDLTKWAVIACDQFTSEPEYWHEVERIVGDAPSTLKLTFPEVYLEKPGEEERIRNIQAEMKRYMDEGILQPHEGFVYVERTANGRTRKGVMLCLDLECYDFNKGSSSLIRATEGTIIERLPPRMKIREGALLEFPHILVLIDDPGKTVIEPLSAAKSQFEKLYDFDLMLESGHLAGYAVNADFENRVVEALRELAKPETFASKYDLAPNLPILLFAMGDGNHSLATAKAIWEKVKAQVGMDHPARYALVEIENVHDEALEFEPIHRVLFGLKKDIFAEMQAFFGANYEYSPAAGGAEMIQRVDHADGRNQLIGVVGGGQRFGVIEIANPSTNLAVGTLQSFLDSFLKNGGAEKIDYVHGEDVVERLALQNGNVGFYLAGMHKNELFKTVILDGALPRKTFSMGEAREKRFYMEGRKITK